MIFPVIWSPFCQSGSQNIHYMDQILSLSTLCPCILAFCLCLFCHEQWKHLAWGCLVLWSEWCQFGYTGVLYLAGYVGSAPSLFSLHASLTMSCAGGVSHLYKLQCSGCISFFFTVQRRICLSSLDSTKTLAYKKVQDGNITGHMNEIHKVHVCMHTHTGIY